VTRGADVEVERNRRLDEAREVRVDLAAALSGEVPDEAQAGLEVRGEVVELDVRGTADRVRLLVVPADTQVELDVARDLEVVLQVEALDVRVDELAARVELEVAGANHVQEQERVGRADRDRAGGNGRDARAGERAGGNQLLDAAGA